VFLLVLLMAVFAVLPGSAAGDQRIDAIRKRMEDGLALFVAGKAQQAAAQFDAGYAEQPYSAFLFNAGVCYEKLGKSSEALARYEKYVEVDPEAPDIADVRARIARLKQALGPPEPEVDGAPPPRRAAPPDTGSDSMRSLVVIETEPSGAPVRVFRPLGAHPPPFQLGASNPSWAEIVTTTAPTSLSLGVGLYHIVIDEFQDFNASDTQLRVSAGHVHHFKANLSQGVFMAFLRVSSNVRGAHLWLDKVDKSRPEWGTTPYGELVPVGKHKIFVEAPGFNPASTEVTLDGGERREVQVELTRVDHGLLLVDAMDAPEAWVSLDGKSVGRWVKGGPGLEVKASAGKHHLVVESDGRKDFDGSVEVPRGQLLPLHVRLIPKYPRGAAWIQAGLSAVLIGGGIYLGSESQTIEKDLDEQRRLGTLAADDPDIVKGKWFAIGANGAFAAGGLLAALSTWNFIKDPLPDSSLTADELREFDDPSARRPVAPVTLRPPTRLLEPRRESARRRIEVSPIFGDGFGGVGFGGTF